MKLPPFFFPSMYNPRQTSGVISGSNKPTMTYNYGQGKPYHYESHQTSQGRHGDYPPNPMQPPRGWSTKSWQEYLSQPNDTTPTIPTPPMSTSQPELLTADRAACISDEVDRILDEIYRAIPEREIKTSYGLSETEEIISRMGYTVEAVTPDPSATATLPGTTITISW